MSRDNFFMPHWSKYRGEEISTVPRHHLEWLLEQEWIDKHSELVEAIEEELATRDRSYDTF